MRLAAIDIGTNSIHMVIAQASSAADFEVIDREREVVQVGAGSFDAGSLRGDAIRRTVEALSRYVQLARRHHVDKILCTATAAVREAENGGEFLQSARETAGVTPRVIPAEEEGRLIQRAVRAALKLDDKPTLVVDIGGGSMQLVLGHGAVIERVASVPLGALRLTETRVQSDPPGADELQELQRHIRGRRRRRLRRSAIPSRRGRAARAIHASAHAMCAEVASRCARSTATCWRPTS